MHTLNVRRTNEIGMRTEVIADEATHVIICSVDEGPDNGSVIQRMVWLFVQELGRIYMSWQ